jgi:hypothetical protein
LSYSDYLKFDKSLPDYGDFLVEFISTNNFGESFASSIDSSFEMERMKWRSGKIDDYIVNCNSRYNSTEFELYCNLNYHEKLASVIENIVSFWKQYDPEYPRGLKLESLNIEELTVGDWKWTSI